MDSKSDPPFDLDGAWKPHACMTVQEYFQEAYEKLDTGCTHAFRGAKRPFGSLRPSFDRWIDQWKIPAADAVRTETQLLEEFLLQAWSHLTPQERHRCLLSEVRWGSKRNTGALVVARHRLVLTRCLDWTDCPLCSLFFACEGECQTDGEVWWFNKYEFDRCVEAQWPKLFGKPGWVEAEIEQEFIKGRDGSWLTTLRYMQIRDDRLDRQKAWITVAGRLRTCHAKEIHRLGVRHKGRLVIPAKLKPEAIRLLEQLGITGESLGLNDGGPADEVGAKIKNELEQEYRAKKSATPCEEAR